MRFARTVQEAFHGRMAGELALGNDWRVIEGFLAVRQSAGVDRAWAG